MKLKLSDPFKRHWLTIIGVLFLIVGGVLGYRPLSEYWGDNQPPVAFAAPTHGATATPTSTPTKPVISGHPVRLQIPSLGFDLTIIDGYYNATSKTWNLTKDEVQYATITPEPNDAGGNTFMYGHNRREVFEFLYKIQPGAQAIVTTDNGHTFTYTYVGARTTNPNDDSLFAYQGPPILTLQTCSGPVYQYRQLFTFTLTEAK